jgi:hypothetical protein
VRRDYILGPCLAAPWKEEERKVGGMGERGRGDCGMGVEVGGGGDGNGSWGRRG